MMVGPLTAGKPEVGPEKVVVKRTIRPFPRTQIQVLKGRRERDFQGAAGIASSQGKRFKVVTNYTNPSQHSGSVCAHTDVSDWNR